MKIEIDFETDFDRGKALPIHIGRLSIGNHIGRFYFSPKGKTVLYINSKAIEDGSVVLLKNCDNITGLGKVEKKKE